MALRRRRSRKFSNADKFGGYPLTLAKILIAVEAYASAFALPVLVLGLFTAFAWLGVFTALYPWAHLVALVLFTAWFFAALRVARIAYRRPSQALARRRLEKANRLQHRPLDVVDDRPVAADAAQQVLWHLHVERSQAQLKKLRAPRWGLSFALRDPYALRYALCFMLLIGGVFSWGQWGDKIKEAMNPALGEGWRAAPLTMNAWITPPEYTGQPPVMIATPAGLRHTNDVVDVPEGSMLSIHLAEAGATPVLEVNGVQTPMVADDANNFSLTQNISSGDSIKLQRGWRTIGNWKIRLVPDTVPQIALTDTPTTTERKTTKLSYEASDDYGVQTITAIVSPTMSSPGLSSDPVQVPLSAPQSKQLKQVDYQDLTAYPWAGMPVNVQLAASDAAGHTSVSEVKSFTLPERIFMHPLARALSEERKKLLQKQDNQTRDEAANVMAGIARQPDAYRGDLLVLMALRTGAVRLVLDRGAEAVPAVTGLMWQAAARIEDGTVGMAQDELRKAQRDLADALNRNASDAEIQQLIDRMHAALAQYLNELGARVGQLPEVPGLNDVPGLKTNMLTPDDLFKMLDEMRNLSGKDARENARQQLAQLQDLLENIRTKPPELTAEQKEALAQMGALKALVKQQQELLDKSFQASKGEQEPSAATKKELARQQQDILQQLQALMKRSSPPSNNLGTSETAMQGAEGALQEGAMPVAQRRQGQAISAMQQDLKSMMEKMREQMMAMPGMQPGGRDPFGRAMPQNKISDDGSVKVPDQLGIQRAREILDELQRRAGDGGRPKTERDYLERLLKRF